MFIRWGDNFISFYFLGVNILHTFILIGRKKVEKEITFCFVEKCIRIYKTEVWDRACGSHFIELNSILEYQNLKLVTFQSDSCTVCPTQELANDAGSCGAAGTAPTPERSGEISTLMKPRSVL